MSVRANYRDEGYAEVWTEDNQVVGFIQQLDEDDWVASWRVGYGGESLGHAETADEAVALVQEEFDTRPPPPPPPRPAYLDYPEKAALWDEVVKLASQEHMTHHLLGDYVRRLVQENSK